LGLAIVGEYSDCCLHGSCLGLLQVEGVKEVSDYVARLRRAGVGLGEYEFDRDMSQRANTLAGEVAARLFP
jgi:hypothetical protein